MKKQKIVIVTEKLDPHADSLILLLREMGHDPIRFHKADIPLQSSMQIEYNGTQWDTSVITKKRTIHFDEIGSIWWRRNSPHELPPALTHDERQFALSELHHAVTGMWEALEQRCYWVSFPHNIRKASYKLNQLQMATRLGLQVPRTLVSSDPEHIRQFFEECQREIIYKALGDPMPIKNESRAIYSTPLHEDHFALLNRTVQTAPNLFQEYIHKALELRVTVIGDEIFTAELHSQDYEETRYDWRHYDVDVPMYKHTLPVEIEEQCFALTKAYGLNFSASDFILTPDGRYVFLEMNPNGQWLFVQHRVPELHMREALAACLIRGANS